jgi:dihydrofolate reductase
MSKVRVASFSVSLDGFAAGPDQDLDNPMGVGGMALHDWALQTRTFQRMFGKATGSTGPDDDFAARGFDNLGAWIIGRNMFGPSAAHGPTNCGAVGGEKTRPITRPCSCSPIIRGRH